MMRRIVAAPPFSFRHDRPYSRGNQLENHCVNDPMIR